MSNTAQDSLEGEAEGAACVLRWCACRCSRGRGNRLCLEVVRLRATATIIIIISVIIIISIIIISIIHKYIHTDRHTDIHSYMHKVFSSDRGKRGRFRRGTTRPWQGGAFPHGNHCDPYKHRAKGEIPMSHTSAASAPELPTIANDQAHWQKQQP